MGENSDLEREGAAKPGRDRLSHASFIRLFVLVGIPIVSLIALPQMVPDINLLSWLGAALLWPLLVAIYSWFYAYPILVLWTLMTQRRWVDRSLDARIAASFQLPVHDETRLARTDP